MDSRKLEIISILVKHHNEIVQRMLRARKAATLRLINRSRRHFKKMRRVSMESFGEMLLSAPAMSVVNIVPSIRTIGRKERSSAWWDRDVLQTHDHDQWLENFRMKRETFFKLVDLVRDQLAVADSPVVEGLSVEKKVAIAVYKLASSAGYSMIGNKFGVSKSTVCVCVHAFCKALLATQAQRLLSWPSPAECESIARAFEEKYQLPNIIGAIDETRVPLAPAPQGGAVGFRKEHASITVQAVVDHSLLFRDVTAQHTGHGTFVFRNSSLYHNHHRMFPESSRVIDGKDDAAGEPTTFRLPYYLIGDPAYPLCDWVMTNYGNERSDEEVSFSLYLEKARTLVKEAFGRLKGRWRVLGKKSDLDISNMPHIIVTCCILHNFVEMAGQQYLPQWDQHRLEDDRQLPQPQRNANEERDDGLNGNRMRDHLCAYMARHYALLDQ